MMTRTEMKQHPKVKEWLGQYEKTQQGKRAGELDRFLQFIKKDVDQVLTEFQDSKDKNEWSRRMGYEIVRFYKSLVNSGLAVNTGRTFTIGPRSFFSYACQPVKVKRGSIQRQQIARGEHDFNQRELQQMFFFANTYDKTLLATGVSIGYSSQDFLNLKRSEMEKLIKYAESNKLEFVHFDTYRGKTEELTRSFLMPEASKCLKMYVETNEPNKEDKLFDLSQDALNDHLKLMVKAANIVTRGVVKWNLLRKFLFSSAMRATNILSAKLLTGKVVPADLLTYYLEGGKLAEEFKKVYPYIRLSENGSRIAKTEQELGMYKTVLVKLIREAMKDIDPNMPDDDVINLYMTRP